MKIGDLRRELANVQHRHGNISVTRHNSCCCYGDDEPDVENVTIEQDPGFEPYVLIR